MREGAYFIIICKHAFLLKNKHGLKVMQKKQKNSIVTLFGAIAATIFFVPFLALSATSTSTVPTVDDCVSHTGMTKEKCTEMMNNFKNPTSGGVAKMESPQNGTSNQKQTPSARGDSTAGQVTVDAASTIDAKIEKVTNVKAQKADQFSQIENRIEKIIEFLKSKDIDTTEIENDLTTFKSKATLVTEAFDSYIQALTDSKTSTTTAETTTISTNDNQTKIKTLTDDLVDFYNSTFRVSLNTAIEKITQ